MSRDAKLVLLAVLCLLALTGCGGGGDLKRGISARCYDGEIDFATSCGGLCFGHDGVAEYIQGCD